MEQCSVKLKRDSILMDHSHTNLKAMVLNIRNKETRNVTLLQPAKTDLIVSEHGNVQLRVTQNIEF